MGLEIWEFNPFVWERALPAVLADVGLVLVDD
jgi:hypothetical protein